MIDFNDIYNFFFGKKSQSKDTAKSRLKFVIMQDRMNCSAKVLDMMKADIIQVISKYMVIDEEALNIQISESKNSGGDKNETSIFFDIPIKSMKNEAEPAK